MKSLILDSLKTGYGMYEFRRIFRCRNGDDAYGVEILKINSVFRHMMGVKSYNILKSIKNMDAMIAELKEYQNKDYTLILYGHSEPEAWDDVSIKISSTKGQRVGW